jgi:serine/threonine protein kinase
MTTAKSQASDVVEALDKGANDYVTKPIELDVLLARMRVHMRPSTGPLAPVIQAPPASTYVGPGAVLDRKYRLDQVIGTGGFGTVYRGSHLALDKDVAVKVLHPHLLESKNAVRRFAMEGVSGCRVRHANAVAILDAGSTPEGVPYLVMELLEGRSLADELEERGALPLSRCAAIIVPVCDALAAAHEAGIVHRDVKPGNIMLSVGSKGEEVVKVLDFGIATLAESEPGQPRAAGEVTGTPHYMAPERLLGKASDDRADVYGVGVTLYEMLSARLPFPRGGRSLLQRAMERLNGIPTNLLTVRPDLPQDLVRMVMAALATEPAGRCRVAELRDAVSHWAGRWAEPEWPPPTLSEYIAGARESSSEPALSAPTTVPATRDSGDLGKSRPDEPDTVVEIGDLKGKRR